MENTQRSTINSQEILATILRYLVDVSRFGVEIAPGDELAAWLDQQEA